MSAPDTRQHAESAMADLKAETGDAHSAYYTQGLTNWIPTLARDLLVALDRVDALEADNARLKTDLHYATQTLSQNGGQGLNATPTLGSVRAKLARGGALFASDEMALVVGRVDELTEALRGWAALLERDADEAQYVGETMEQGSMERREYMGDASRNRGFAIRLRELAAGVDEPAAAPPEKERHG